MLFCLYSCVCLEDGEEDAVGVGDGRLELDDQILQEQLLGWIQTGGDQHVNTHKTSLYFLFTFISLLYRTPLICF